ncbi:hypothetical protein MMC25_007233 [Agyrium rufum]|nr:hypothetical protein [Agyrium rufum]
MSIIGISPLDILKAIQFAHTIHETFFKKINRAELKYLEFGDEIKFLESSLIKLGDVFESANRERQQRVYDNTSRDLDLATDQERRELVGDFEETLARCDVLLKQNCQNLTKVGGVWQNAKWLIGGSPKVIESLRSRVQFHSIKILLILEPLKCQLLAEISENVWDIKEDVRALRYELRLYMTNGAAVVDPSAGDTLPHIPETLRTRFEEALQVGKPSTFINDDSFPLREGLDALISHFRESTVRFNELELEHSAPSVEQYLNLIKARYILEKLKGSSRVQDDSPSLWSRSILVYQKKILGQFRRFGRDLASAEEENIARLGPDAFMIWLAEEPIDAPRLITDEDNGEEKILELELPLMQGFSKRSLMIFRQSANEMRLVRSAVPEGENFPPQSDEKIINLHAFQISPHYAIPSQGNDSNNIHVSHSHVHRGDFFDLRSRADVHKLQRALTGYKVVHASNHINWTLCKRSWPKTSQEEGKGHFQIWQPKACPRILPLDLAGCEPMSPTTSQLDHKSQASVSSTLAEKLTSKYHGSLASITGSSGDEEQTITSSMPRLPVIVLFTRWKRQLTFLHLQLDEHMKINHGSCSCRHSRGTCREIVIECKPPNRTKFQMRRHSASKDSAGNDLLSTWNLALLGLPRHPDFKAIEVLGDVVWFSIVFESVLEREAFENDFETASVLRNSQLKEFRSLGKAVNWRADNPGFNK